jgi:phosphoribosylformylglycinamidine synthase
MISESQERMLAVVEPERVDAVLSACERWETGATVIGRVTDSRRLRVFDGEELVADLPVEVLVDGCPLYDLEPAEPQGWLYENGGGPALASQVPADETLRALLASPNIASKRWVFEQYDSIVLSRTVRRPEQADAAVLQLPETGGAIAVAIDGNGRRVACDPYRGAVEAVLECAANLACVGAEPLGLTNCLNFGNPEKPHVAWQLTRAVEGLADACEALGLPVVGGNVSLYNEAPEGPIYPTPVVGIVGELPDPARAGSLNFGNEGDAVALVGVFAPSLAGSELAKLRGELGPGLPEPDVEAAAGAMAAVRGAVRAGKLTSAHDVSDGGLAVAIAESAIAGGIGVRIDLSALAALCGSAEAALFGEGSGGFLVSGDHEELERLAGEEVPLLTIGRVGGDAIDIEVSDVEISLPVADAAAAWRSLESRVAEPAGV